MGRIYKKTKVRVILVLMSMVTLLYYLTPVRLSLLQELCTRFFYVPIILGGLWFGLWGGVRVSLFVTLICIPHAFMAFRYDQALFYDELLELFLFILIGPVVGALRDRESRQRAFNQKIQALAAIGETVSSVAHEMKNMLIPMRGFLRRLREKPTGDEKGASYLEIVDREAAKLDKMVKDMLAFGRHAPLQREDVEVGSLVEDMRQILDAEFHQNGIRLVCRYQEGGKRVPLDRERIRNALANLLHNALEASSKGKEVRLLVQHDLHFLRIMIEDEGAGIPKEHLDRIFHPFFTTKPQGTGLGLAITQRIVKEHGGEIRVESTPGTGTRFIMSFPIIE
jgi:signal transduction histidine kinase